MTKLLLHSENGSHVQALKDIILAALKDAEATVALVVPPEGEQRARDVATQWVFDRASPVTAERGSRLTLITVGASNVAARFSHIVVWVGPFNAEPMQVRLVARMQEWLELNCFTRAGESGQIIVAGESGHPLLASYARQAMRWDVRRCQ